MANMLRNRSGAVLLGIAALAVFIILNLGASALTGPPKGGPREVATAAASGSCAFPCVAGDRGVRQHTTNRRLVTTTRHHTVGSHR